MTGKRCMVIIDLPAFAFSYFHAASSRTVLNERFVHQFRKQMQTAVKNLTSRLATVDVPNTQSFLAAPTKGKVVKMPTNIAKQPFYKPVPSVLPKYHGTPKNKVVAVFENGSCPWRTKIFPQYKQKRREDTERYRMLTNAGFFRCLEDARLWCQEHVGAVSIPPPGARPRKGLSGKGTFPGFEADDAIATVARMARRRGYTVVIYGVDKDLFQLMGEDVEKCSDSTVKRAVGAKASPKKKKKSPPKKGSGSDSNVFILHPSKGFLWKPYVESRYGIPSDRLGDFLALVGDPVDGVPGLAGVGPTTARKIILQHGSLEEFIEAKGGEHRPTLTSAEAKQLRLSRQLVELRNIDAVEKLNLC